MKRTVFTLLWIAALLCALAVSATAETDVVASGVWGTCAWEMDADGCMTIHAGTAAAEGGAPWWYHCEVKRIVIEETVIVPENTFFSFGESHYLVSLDLSGLDTSRMTSMYSMFENCSSLAALDLSSLEALDLSGLDASNVENMASIFHNCAKLAMVKLPHSIGANMTEMTCMFENCRRLTTLDLSPLSGVNLTICIISWQTVSPWSQ